MWTILKTGLGVVTGNLVPIVAGIALVVLLTTIAILGWQNHSLQNRLDAKTRALAQAQSVIEFQNDRVEAFRTAVEAARSRATAAGKAADAAHESDERTITRLLTRPFAPADLACKAADDTILEFAR